MNVKMLRYFVACVEHKTMHAAAAAIHISQPALSKAVSNLEADLGVRLLDRQPRGVVPTPYGETLFRYAKLINSELRRAVAEIDAMRGMTRGTIVVGVIPTMCAIMASVAREVLANHPGLRLHLRVAFSTELTKMLGDGEVDIALILPPQDGAPAGLTFDPLMRTEPVIAVREGHPLAGRSGLSLRELATFPWAIPDYPASHREIVSRVFLRAGVSPPATAVDISTVVFFQSLIQQTDLVTIAPAALLNTFEGGGRLVALDIDFRFPLEEVGIAYRENTTLLPGARVVIDLARENCGRLSDPSN